MSQILLTNATIGRGKLVMATRVQIQGETDCISHSTNTFAKGMNPIIFVIIGK